MIDGHEQFGEKLGALHAINLCWCQDSLLPQKRMELPNEALRFLQNWACIKTRVTLFTRSQPLTCRIDSDEQINNLVQFPTDFNCLNLVRTNRRLDLIAILSQILPAVPVETVTKI